MIISRTQIITCCNIIFLMFLLTSCNSKQEVVSVSNDEVIEYIQRSQAKGETAYIKAKFGNDLRGLKLVGIDLKGADFTDVDLRNIYFSQVNLEGADFSGSNTSK